VTVTAPYFNRAGPYRKLESGGADFGTPESERRMRVFLAGLFVAPLLVLAGDENRVCSASTLKGDYGLIVTGTRTVGPVTENFVTLSLVTFDGNGGFTAEGVSHGATTGVRKGPASGTYTVNANCTGAWTTNIQALPPLPAEVVIVDRGREVLVSAVSATEVSSGRARRK
jgi:hypothetical protein